MTTQRSEGNSVADDTTTTEADTEAGTETHQAQQAKPFEITQVSQ